MKKGLLMMMGALGAVWAVLAAIKAYGVFDLLVALFVVACLSGLVVFTVKASRGEVGG